MGVYELTIILNSNLDKSATEKALERVKKFIVDAKGKLKETKEWGKKQFSYQFKKQKEGNYYFLDLEIDEKEVGELAKKIKLEENILRHLLLRKE